MTAPDRFERASFWTGGESLHNNHHAHPRAAKFSVRRSEFDPSWSFIQGLAAVRLLAIIGPPVALAPSPIVRPGPLATAPTRAVR